MCWSWSWSGLVLRVDASGQGVNELLLVVIGVVSSISIGRGAEGLPSRRILDSRESRVD